MRVAANLISRSPARTQVCLLRHALPVGRVLCGAQSDSHDIRESRPNQADALRQSLSSVSSNTGRIAQTRNFVLGSDNSEASWRALDEQVCSHHPSTVGSLKLQHRCSNSCCRAGMTSCSHKPSFKIKCMHKHCSAWTSSLACRSTHTLGIEASKPLVWVEKILCKP